MHLPLESGAVLCHVAYQLNPAQLAAFQEYATVWVGLVQTYGGTHHGFYIATSAPPSAAISFPGIGREASDQLGVAIFSFPDAQAYADYREQVATDPSCRSAEELVKSTRCFTAYERGFIRRIA